MPSPLTEEELIAHLLGLPPTARTAALDEACSADPSLRDRRPALLAAVSATVSSRPADQALHAFASALAAAPEDASGAQIGPYKLLQKIGEGGFGSVWMAEQLEPIRRRVAVKIIKLGMDTAEVITRFEAERQALALMEHPNIARVFDAGATDSGRPYFVMELVRGVAITRYCDEARLSASARLRLFITVCQAVQHAHQKGVIHRDLKPSNILVTLHDGVPVPKIIDFGIVKATSARLTEKTLFTQFHSFIGTPAYTSPEQMEMSGLDIDTRSDIYSLGVLLYELLTGHPPFDADALMKSGLEAMRRTIREIDPPPPSSSLGTLSQANRTSVAQQRSTDPGKLSLLLRGDLDWIAMRCLEKDRTRRYDSATSLAADIERHLNDGIVEARPPSRVYQAKKFVRRHRLAVAAAAAVTASLIAGLVVSSTLFVRERSAHGRATTAEKKEGELRRQAEAARTTEVKRAARTALDLANRNLTDGRIADGLAYLVYAARKDPENTTLPPRLASALAMHNFLLPEGPAFDYGSRVLALRFTQDGRSIHIGTEDGTFRVLEAASGRLLHEFPLGRPVMLGGWEFPRNNDAVFAVRFTDKTLGVFDVESGRPRWAPLALDPMVVGFGEHIGMGHGVGLSPDGRWVYALGGKRFWIWDAVTGALRLQPVFDHGVQSCDFPADGTELAVTIGGAVKRWTLPDATPLAPRGAAASPATDNIPTTVRLSPDGRRLAVSNARAGVKLFDTATGGLLRTLPPPGNYLFNSTVEFVSDHRLFGAGARASGWWDLTTGEFKTLPVAAGEELVSTGFAASGRRMLATGTDGFVRLCDLDSGELVAEPAWQQSRAFCAALAPDGAHVVIGTASGTILRLRVGRGPARPLILPRVLSTPMPAPFLPELPARLLWMAGDHARVLDLASGREVAGGFTYPEPVLRIGSVDNSPPVRPDLKFTVVRTGHGWQAWKLGPTGVTHVAVLLGMSPTGGGAPRFSPQGDLVELCQPNSSVPEMGVWDLHTGARAGPAFTHPASIVFMTPNFSPDGRRIALGTADGASMILDVATARPVVTFATRPLVPNQAVWFSPDGTRVVTSNIQNETRVWDAATGEPVSPLMNIADAQGSAQYSPDGRWFLTWGARTTNLWDGRTGAPVGETIPASGKSVRFSPDSRSVGTTDAEGKVQVWDAPSGQPITQPMRYGANRVVAPQFSPDSRFLRVESDKFSVWSVPPRATDGAPVPEWLLQLATVCATKAVNDSGQLVDVPDVWTRLDEVRRQLAALPVDAPYAEWGRWILDGRVDRPIAPGFTITPAEADDLAARLAAIAGVGPP